MAISRRQLIGFGLATGAGVALTGLGSLFPSMPFVKPPRALAGPLFSSRCMRCGACVQACPTRALAQRDLSLDFKGTGMPYMQAENGGCTAWKDGCRLCAEACPSGALDPSLPLEGVKLGVARFNPEQCTNCMLCLRYCPVEKAVYFPNPEGGSPWYKEKEHDIPSELNSVLSPVKPCIDENLCVGCGICAAHCIPRIIHLDPL